MPESANDRDVRGRTELMFWANGGREPVGDDCEERRQEDEQRPRIRTNREENGDNRRGDD